MNARIRALVPFAVAAAIVAATSTIDVARAQDAEPPRRAYEDIPIPPLPDFDPPQASRHQLDNGVTVYLLPDRTLPLVDVTVWIKGGTDHDPAGQTGLSDVAAEVIRAGGTHERPGDELDEFLDRMGASIELGAAGDHLTASASFLARDAQQVLTVFADLLVDPALPEDRIETVRAALRAGIARRNDDPAGIARRVVPKLIFGAGHPYAAEVEPDGVDAIDRASLVALHRARFVATGASIAVTGDFEQDAILAFLDRGFGELRPRPASIDEPPFPRPIRRQKLYLVRKDDVNQSTIVLARRGRARSPGDPDWAPFLVANHVFGGGGFSSRLLRIIRSQEGLAYGVGSSLGAEYGRPGIQTITTQTRSDATVKAIRSLLREATRMGTEPPSVEEIAVAKDALLNSMVFSFDSPGKIVERAQRLGWYDFPADYLKTLRAAIDAVTPEDVARVSKFAFTPDAFTIVVVANDAELDEPLTALQLGDPVLVEVAGTITELVLEGSSAGPAPSTIPVDPEAVTKAKAVIDRAVLALGGREKLAAVRVTQMRVKTFVKTAQGDMELPAQQTLAYPDRYKVEIETPYGSVIQALAGDEAWVQQPDGRHGAAPPRQRVEMRKTIRSDPIALIRELAGIAPGLGAGEHRPVVQWRAEEKVNGRLADVIHVLLPWAAGESGRAPDPLGLTIWVERKTGHILRRKVDTAPDRSVEFTDYREVEGIAFAFKIRQLAGTDAVAAIAVEAVEVDPELAEGFFLEPPD